MDTKTRNEIFQRLSNVLMQYDLSVGQAILLVEGFKEYIMLDTKLANTVKVPAPKFYDPVKFAELKRQLMDDHRAFFGAPDDYINGDIKFK